MPNAPASNMGRHQENDYRRLLLLYYIVYWGYIGIMEKIRETTIIGFLNVRPRGVHHTSRRHPPLARHQKRRPREGVAEMLVEMIGASTVNS